jgi:DNA-binding SARP family transcriptional activator
VKGLAGKRRDQGPTRSPAGSDIGEPRLLVRVLGPTAVTDRGHPLPLPGGRPAALLAWLVAHRASGVSVSASVAALWPHLDQAAGARELRRNLAVLRQQLAPARLMGVRRGAQLELVVPAGAAVDVDLFEGGLAAAEDASARRARRPALSLVRQALALWRGDGPFVEIRETPVGGEESVRLGRLRLRALDLRDGLRLQLDPDSRLLTDLEAKVAADPGHELGWRQVMVAMYEAGHRAGALRAFQACRRTLRGLGRAPCDETRLVETALLAGRAPEPHLYMPEPASDDGSRVERPPSAGAGSALEAIVDEAWQWPSRARLAVLIGGPTTAGELADIARQRGGDVALVRASDQPDSRPALHSMRNGVPSALIVDGAEDAPARLLGAVGDLRRGPGPALIALVTGPAGVARLSELVLHADRVLEIPVTRV